MRRHRSYKFTDKKHSKGGVRSSIIGGVSLLCTFIGVYTAYLMKGEAGKYLVIFGILAIAACIYGMFVGGKSFREEEVYYLFSRVGTIINVLLFVFWSAVIVLGYMI